MFSKVERYKIYFKKTVAFLYTNNEQTEKEFRKTILFTLQYPSKKIPRHKLNKESERPLQ
jgi:hypothetical protein